MQVEMNSRLGFSNSKVEGNKLSPATAPTALPRSLKQEQMEAQCGREKHYMEIAGGILFFNLLWARQTRGESWAGLEQG